MNDLPDDLKSIWKIFADDMSSFLKVKDLNTGNINILTLKATQLK